MKVSTQPYLWLLYRTFSCCIKLLSHIRSSHCCIIIEIENYHFYCYLAILAFLIHVATRHTWPGTQNSTTWRDNALTHTFWWEWSSKIRFLTIFLTYFPIIIAIITPFTAIQQNTTDRHTDNFLMVEFIWHLFSLSLCEAVSVLFRQQNGNYKIVLLQCRYVWNEEVFRILWEWLLLRHCEI